MRLVVDFFPLYQGTIVRLRPLRVVRPLMRHHIMRLHIFMRTTTTIGFKSRFTIIGDEC